MRKIKIQTTAHKLQPQKNGFTLIELLVASSIFAIFIAISANSLVSTINLERRASILRKTQQDTRYILESIMREAKTANGEYDALPEDGGVRATHAFQVVGPLSDQLVIYSTDFVTEKVSKNTFYWSDEGAIMEVKEERNIGETGAYSTVATLELNDSGKIFVEKFEFLITNFGGLDVPPKLTVDIDAVSKEGRDSGNALLRARTTLTSTATSRSY